MEDRTQENGEKSGQSDDTTDAEVMIEHFGDMHVGGEEGGRAAKEKTLEMTAGQSLTAEQVGTLTEVGVYLYLRQKGTLNVLFSLNSTTVENDAARGAGHF